MALTYIDIKKIGGKTYTYVRPSLYRTWTNMKSRCLNPNVPAYRDYGGRGILICSDWMEYSKFEEWANNSGYADGLEIDRIDNNAGYCPDNCRFVESRLQSENRRCVKKYSKDGFTGTLRQWSERIKVARSTLAQRLYVYKWNINDVLTEEV